MALSRSIVLGLFAIIVSSAQQYSFVHIPGSPPDAVAMLQDSRGRLWVGTNNDAFCFDGSRFLSLRPYGFPSDVVSQFAEDDSGAIWIAAQTGLYRFFGGQVSQILRAFVASVVPLGRDSILATIGPLGGTTPPNASLVKITQQGKAWKNSRLMDTKSEGILTIDHKKVIRFPCSGHWCEARSEDIARWQPGETLPVIQHQEPLPAAGGVTGDRFGCIWWNSNLGTRYRCPGDHRQTVVEHGPTSLAEAPDGSLILPDPGKIAIGRPGAFKTATTANGLPNVASAMFGQDGTIWISSANGLTRLATPLRVEYWNERDGLSGPWTSVQFEGQTFVTSELGGIGVLSRDRKRWITLEKSLGLGGTVDLLPTDHRSLLVATLYSGVAEVALDGTILARSSPEDGPLVLKLARTSDGQIWTAGGRGVARLSRAGNKLILKQEDLPEPRINGRDIEYDPRSGRLWACYEGGLALREKNRWRTFNTANGLLQNPCRALAAHSNGDLWYMYVSTPAFSLLRPNGTGWVPIRNYRGGGEVGPALGGEFLDVDSRGWLWRGDLDGVSVADAGSAEAGTWLHINEVDGLPSHNAQQQSFHEDPDGSVWWSGGNEVVHFSPPADFLHPRFSPKVFLSAFSWDGVSPTLAEAIPAIPHSVKLIAHIGSLQFDRRNALRLRYRILPSQPEWRTTKVLDIALGKLDWGEHTLELQAMLLNGPWSETISHRISVLKPLWLTWPLLALYALAICCVVSAVLVSLKQRAERKNKILPDLSSWRLAALSPEVHELIGGALDRRFEVNQVLARGGFATVLEGEDRGRQHQRCAIKIFHQDVVETDWIERRFKQEVSALESIDHPNIVRIYGHGLTPSGSPYLVMEFIEGLTLRELMEVGKVPLTRVATWMRQAGSALDAIHRRCIFHRDLKPDNIMIRTSSSPETELVIIDFSIAIVQDPETSLHGLTRAAGSIVYMAPENAVGYADSSTDIHSLAKILLEMLTGRKLMELLPDASIDLSARARDLLAGDAFGLSSGAIDMVAAALEFHPANRPKTAGAFTSRIAEDLEAAAALPFSR